MAAKEKKILKYETGTMEKAVEAVKKGMPTQTAAKQFGVPKTTLHYHVIGKYELYKPIGAKTAFTPEEEGILVKWVLGSASKGFPVTKGNFLFSVGQLARELNVHFKNDTPSRKWFEGFMRRHPTVSLRTAQNMTTSRASVTKKNVHEWFEEVYKELESNQNENLLKQPEKIFNLDETAFFLNPKENFVLARKGDKNVYIKSGSNEKECLSVLVGGSAAGDLCPSMIIFDYKRVPAEISSSMPAGWGIGLSDNGWSTYDVFYCYIVNIFYPWAKENVGLPIVLFVDGHVSHLSYELSVFCEKNGIILVALYPNSTHFLQPMDVAIFRTLKDGWREQVNMWKIKNSKPEMKKHEFAPVLQAVLDERVTPTVMANGFRKCGLYPWDNSAVNSYFDKKNQQKNQTPDVGKSNSTYSLRRSIQCLETYIQPEKLISFKEAGEAWEGPEADKSLFTLWRKMYSDLLSLNMSCSNQNSDIPSTSIEILPSQETVPDNIESCFSKEAVPIDNSTMIRLDLSEECKTPEKEVVDSPILTTPIRNSMSDSPSIPTPFKKALFFPSEKTKKPTQRKREKIPSVVSSKLWQEYSEKKKAKKELQEKVKVEKKRLREEKKKQKELMSKKQRLNKDDDKTSKVTKRQLKYEQESNSSEDLNNFSCIDSDQDCDMETFSDLEGQTYKISDFVIVFYEQEYFPGQIKDMRKNIDETGNEYLVTVMTMSGPNGWRWPETEDKIWYEEGQMLEKITPPSITNSRGVCTVQAILKYRQKAR